MAIGFLHAECGVNPHNLILSRVAAFRRYCTFCALPEVTWHVSIITLVMFAQTSYYREQWMVVVTKEDRVNHGGTTPWNRHAGHYRRWCASQTTAKFSAKLLTIKYSFVSSTYLCSCICALETICDNCRQFLLIFDKMFLQHSLSHPVSAQSWTEQGNARQSMGANFPSSYQEWHWYWIDRKRRYKLSQVFPYAKKAKFSPTTSS